ncbi:MAG: SIR2 family protein [Bacillota bacterium]
MKKVILTGNGLSVGLNRSFALQNITKKFYDQLDVENRAFIEYHMERLKEGKYDQLDFEEAIASIEQIHDSLNHYVTFLTTLEGERFLESYNLKRSELGKHLDTVRQVINTYTSSIVEIIDGNVKWDEIGDNLSGFINFLQSEFKDKQNEFDLFTLNFDLLLETILLKLVDTDLFTDFHIPRGNYDGMAKFNFDPEMAAAVFGERNIKLYHLHGSLSSFKRLDDGRIFKLRTEDMRLGDIYKRVNEHNLVPSIITGGYKSNKIQTSPFNYYYREFKKRMVNPDSLCEELYIIGYSFRDSHINEAISERLRLERKGDTPKKLNKLVIVDYQDSPERKREFVNHINKELKLGSRTSNRFEYDDERIIFDGVDAIENVIY